MINGSHTVIWSHDADVTRAFLRDVLELDSVDAGDGWLLFALPPAEVGIHPTAGAEERLRHELYLMCDDIEATLAELADKGVAIASSPEDQGWGIVAAIDVPGAGSLSLYQPRHPTAFERA